MEETEPQEDQQPYGPWGPDGVPEPVVRLVAGWTARAFDGFRTSPGWQELDDQDRIYAYSIIRSFVTMMLADCGETPNEWSRKSLDFCYQELLPHDYPQGRGYRVSFSRVLYRFLKWLDRDGILSRASSLADYVKDWLPEGHEQCDCAITTEVFDIGSRVMADSGLEFDSLRDTAVYIAKYTEALCGELGREPAPATPQPGEPFLDPSTLSLDLVCPCGSGKRFDKCCGGVN